MSATSKRNRKLEEDSRKDWVPSDGAYDKRYDKKSMKERREMREQMEDLYKMDRFSG